MDKDVRRARHTDLVARAEVFNRLSKSEDWQVWKKEVVDRRLQLLLDEITSLDRRQPDWREKAADKIAAYQEIRAAFEGIFAFWKQIGQRSQEELNKMNEPER